jgi:hypothetical protein
MTPKNKRTRRGRGKQPPTTHGRTAVLTHLPMAPRSPAHLSCERDNVVDTDARVGHPEERDGQAAGRDIALQFSLGGD